jgi:hypothetical protein
MGIGVITDNLEYYLLLGAQETLASAPLTNSVLALYQNNVVPTPGTVLGDLSLANFDGYTPTTLGTWRAPYLGLDRNYQISPSVGGTFTCTGQNTINTVYGACVIDHTGAFLLALQQFDLAITPVSDQSFQVTPEIQVSGTLNACLC